MTPDEQHAEYYRKKPNGNHDTMSPETRVVIDFIKQELSEIKDIIKPIPEMQFTQKQILEQTQKTNGRVTKLEEYRANTEPLIKEVKEERQAKKIWVREHVWKLAAIVMAGALGIDKLDTVKELFL